MAVAQLPPEIEYKDSGYVARAVVFALMCFGCFLGLLLWIGEVIIFIVSIICSHARINDFHSVAVGCAQSCVQTYLSAPFRLRIQSASNIIMPPE